ncbi:MAG: sigma-70 family RNA polymerase sigma factor [Planctomycetes bacterium]|jgi:RNA polymerase sigma-70 factor (ECF subfamily)|nr:sigma-70 family RNA polymerase sigma factor [Planctomycetota bacterium]
MNLDTEFAAQAPFLRALARRLATDPATVDDLVQETYVAALTGPLRRACSPIPWLVAVLRRRAARRIRTDTRRRVREAAAAVDPSSPDTVDVAIKLDVARRLLQHVEALDSPSRAAIFLRYYENLKPAQIAARLGVPLGTVKTRLARALARLRDQLDADRPEGRQNWLPALAAIGGLDPAAEGALAGGAVVRRATMLRPAPIAVGAVLITAVAATAWWPRSTAPSRAPSGPVASATAPSPARHDPLVRREPVAAAAARVTLVQGRVEDAGVGVEPGHGQPAAAVVVRCKLRRANGPAGSPVGSRVASANEPVPLVVTRRGGFELETTTDAQGRFQIEVPADAELVALDAVGTESRRAAHWRAAPGAHEVPDGLVLTRYALGPLEGVVTEPSGAPVAGARVVLARWRGNEREMVETAADQSGHFVFATAARECWLAAECEGFVQVATSDVAERPRGSWQPGRILMAPAGTLVVEPVDSTGAPVHHVDTVGVAISDAEAGLFAATDSTPQRPLLERAPVVQGRATLTVPAGLELILFTDETLFDGQLDGTGLPVGSGSKARQPVVVDAGKELRLRLVLGAPRTLHVGVVGPDGQPAADAKLHFEMVRHGHLEIIGQASTDERGQCALPLAGAWNRSFLLITAVGSGTDDGLRAVRRVLLDAAQPPFAELRLAPAQQLVGRVRDANGRPLRAEVRRMLRFAEVDDWFGFRSYRESDANGAFSVPAIPDAVHRLVIRSDGFRTAFHDDVRVGEALEVVLEPAPAVRLLASAGAAGLRDLWVDVGYLEPSTGREPAWPVLGPTTAWSPASAHALFQRDFAPQIGGVDGRWRFQRHELAPQGQGANGRFELGLDRGPAMIFVTGRDAHGARLSRLTTGPVTISGADVELPLTLAVTATCRGRIQFAAGAERFAACVALADDAGRLLMISAAGHDAVWETVLAASSNGHFGLCNVPIGTWELRVGTREELERGEARQRRQLVIAGDLNEPILIQI